MSAAAAPEHTMEDVTTNSPPEEKDKGKAPAQVPETDESSSEGEDFAEVDEAQADDDEDEDDLAEIDTSNIISGGRTRGKKIDFTTAAQDVMDDEEDDDEDFKAPEDADTMDTN